MWPGQCFGRESSDQQLAGTILLPGLLKEAKESILPVSDCDASVPPVLEKNEVFLLARRETPGFCANPPVFSRCRHRDEGVGHAGESVGEL